MIRAVVVVAALAAASEAHAGGFGIPEIGIRRTAMAATVGRPDEPSAVFHNPAGLTMQHGFRFYASFGLSFVSTEFRLQPWDKSDEYLDDPVDADGYYPATRPERAIGAIPMIVVTRELKPDKIFAAASLYVANGTGAFFNKDAVTRYHLISGYIVSPLLQLSGAYKFNPKLSVGAGLGVLNIRIHGFRDFYPEYQGASLRNLFGTRPELTLDGSDWQPSWNVGVLAAPVDGLTVGATIIGKVHPTLDGPISLKYDEDSSDPGYVLKGTAHTELVLPWTFLAGANYDVTRNVEIGAEFRYYLYRQYQNQHTDIDDIFLLDHLDSVKNYKDSWQTSGGVRVHDVAQVPGLELMLGGHYDKTPAPPQTVALDQPTFSHWGLHTGGRYVIGRYRIGASYVHYWYDIPTITDSITQPPSNIKGDGTNNILSLSFEAVL